MHLRKPTTSRCPNLAPPACDLQIPFAAVARDAWLNLTLPLAELVPLFFRGTPFRSLDALTLSMGGGARLRRAFTLRDAPYDAMGDPLPLPRGLELPADVDVYTQVRAHTQVM